MLVGSSPAGSLRSMKKTSLIHYLCGMVTVLAGIVLGSWTAILCFLCFLAVEVWTKKEWQASQSDFWEFTAGVFVTLAVVLVFNSLGCYL